MCLQFLLLIDGQSYRKGNWNFTLQKHGDNLSTFHWRSKFLSISSSGSCKLRLKVNTTTFRELMNFTTYLQFPPKSPTVKVPRRKLEKKLKNLANSCLRSRPPRTVESSRFCNWDVGAPALAVLVETISHGHFKQTLFSCWVWGWCLGVVIGQCLFTKIRGHGLFILVIVKHLIYVILVYCLWVHRNCTAKGLGHLASYQEV